MFCPKNKNGEYLSVVNPFHKITRTQSVITRCTSPNDLWPLTWFPHKWRPKHEFSIIESLDSEGRYAIVIYGLGFRGQLTSQGDKIRINESFAGRNKIAIETIALLLDKLDQKKFNKADFLNRINSLQIACFTSTLEDYKAIIDALNPFELDKLDQNLAQCSYSGRDNKNFVESLKKLVTAKKQKETKIEEIEKIFYQLINKFQKNDSENDNFWDVKISEIAKLARKTDKSDSVDEQIKPTIDEFLLKKAIDKLHPHAIKLLQDILQKEQPNVSANKDLISTLLRLLADKKTKQNLSPNQIETLIKNLVYYNSSDDALKGLIQEIKSLLRLNLKKTIWADYKIRHITPKYLKRDFIKRLRKVIKKLSCGERNKLLYNLNDILGKNVDKENADKFTKNFTRILKDCIYLASEKSYIDKMPCDRRRAQVYLKDKGKGSNIKTTRVCSAEEAESFFKKAHTTAYHKIEAHLENSRQPIKLSFFGKGSIIAYIARLILGSDVHSCATWLNEIEEVDSAKEPWYLKLLDLFIYIPNLHHKPSLLDKIIFAVNRGEYEEARSLSDISKSDIHYLQGVIKKWFPQLCSRLGWGLSNFKDLKTVIEHCCQDETYFEDTRKADNLNSESMPGRLIYAILSDSWRLIKWEIDQRVKEKMKKPSEKGQKQEKKDAQKSAEQQVGQKLIKLLSENLGESRGNAFLEELKAEKNKQIRTFFEATLEFKQDNFTFKKEKKRKDAIEKEESSSGEKPKKSYSFGNCFPCLFCCGGRRTKTEQPKTTERKTEQEGKGCGCW